MSERITNNILEAAVLRINKLTGSPTVSWERVNGQLKANVGNYHLDYAYGGVALERMETDGGGVSQVFTIGHATKRELYGAMQAFIAGYAAAQHDFEEALADRA